MTYFYTYKIQILKVIATISVIFNYSDCIYCHASRYMKPNEVTRVLTLFGLALLFIYYIYIFVIFFIEPISQ